MSERGFYHVLVCIAAAVVLAMQPMAAAVIGDAASKASLWGLTPTIYTLARIGVAAGYYFTAPQLIAGLEILYAAIVLLMLRSAWVQTKDGGLEDARQSVAWASTLAALPLIVSVATATLQSGDGRGVAVLAPFAVLRTVRQVVEMIRLRPHAAFLVLIAFAVLLAAGFWAVDRAKAMSVICAMEFSNLSRPAQIPVDALDCTVLGKRETIYGVVLSSDHGMSITTKEGAKPISVWLGHSYPRLARQTARSWSDYCVNGATARLVGWRSQTPGRFGHMGYADEQFYVEQIVAVEPLPKWVVAQVDQDRTWCREGSVAE